MLRDAVVGDQNRTAFLARPSQLNDPEDCKPPIRLPVLSQAREYTDRKALELYGPKHAIQRAREAMAALLDIKKMEKVHDDNRERFGVFSMTTRLDSDAMWDVYAGGHRGICVAYGFRPCLRNPGRRESVELFPQPVDYVKELPPVCFLDSFFDETARSETIRNTLFVKTSKWAHEEEWRLMNILEGAQACPQALPLGPVVISDVYLGRRIDAEHARLVSKWARKGTPNVNLWRQTENGQFEPCPDQERLTRPR